VDHPPVVDITTVIAVESLFRSGIRDPWGAELAGHLADLLIYADSARYVLPYATSPEPHEIPDLLRDLAAPEESLLQSIPYKADELREVSPSILTDAFASFSHWAKRNRSRLKDWADLQFQDWVRGGHFARVRPRFVFDVQALERDSAVEVTARRADLTTEQLLHAFDVALRYPLYGELAGDNAPYLAHPLRSTQQLPAVQKKEGPLPPVPISLRRAVSALAPQISQTEYVTLVHEGRKLVRDLALVGAKPGSKDSGDIILISW
jgi:hypothetical protein